ncbi:hypothetical protein [Streptomyces sp. NPDC018347]|uniref:hypothetical protein n=1 Tax=Streptomyces sp. NPDC018347 TaxID=3157193 RepID=UPI00340853CB
MRGSLVGTTVTLAAGALLTAAMTTASAVPPAATAPRHGHGSQPVLVDCRWQRTVRPDDFLLACGDGNSLLTGLRWSEWAPGGATAVGVNMVNDCKPYCAAGAFHSYPVTVRLDGPEPWKKHPYVQRYTRMSLTYADDRPEGYHRVMTYPLWG